MYRKQGGLRSTRPVGNWTDRPLHDWRGNNARKAQFSTVIAGVGHGPTKRIAKSTCRGGARRRCCRDLTPALRECRGALSAEYQKALRAAAHLRPGRQAKSSAWQAATLSASCTRGIPEWVAEVTIGFRVADKARYAARPFVMT
jgi:hypothetical protein